MKNKINNRGITLVTLVIIIVILVIISMAAIVSVNNHNIFNHTEDSVNEFDSTVRSENEKYEGLKGEILGKLPSNSGDDEPNNDDNTGGNGGTDSGNSNPQQPTKLGKYALYDADGDGTIEEGKEQILWRVLRDDEDKVELISADLLGNEYFFHTVSGWTHPQTLEEARYFYNNIVEILVKKCEELTGIKGVRCMGGPAIDNQTETIVFSEYFLPNEGVKFDQYEGTNNGFKKGDSKIYSNDVRQMQLANVTSTDTGGVYLSASRYSSITVNSDGVYFGIRSGYHNNYNSVRLGMNIYFWKNGDYSLNDGQYMPGYMRPILTLDGGSLDNLTGIGSKDNPYKIYKAE